jgi:hypothetical protein
MAHSLSYRRMLTRMGYYNYQNGLIYRHISQEGAWENHLKRSRQFIIKCINLYNPEKITVFGSGWLLDFPIAEIIERTKHVCLIDIVHPPDVINQAGNFKNVELVEQDITGGLIEEVWQKSRNYSPFRRFQMLRNIIVPEYKSHEDPGMVISLNILTQLESLLVKFIKKRARVKEEELSLFRAEIQKQHISFLRKHLSILITDTAEVITGRTGEVETTRTLVTDLPPCRISEEWIWDFDMKGTDLYNSRSYFSITALLI